MKQSLRVLKSVIFLFLLAVTLHQPTSSQGGNWATNSSVPLPREGKVFGINAVFAVGQTFSWKCLAALKTYDPASRQWSVTRRISKSYSPSEDSDSDEEIVDPSQTVAGSSVFAANAERFYAIPQARAPPRIPFPPHQPPQSNENII